MTSLRAFTCGSALLALACAHAPPGNEGDKGGLVAVSSADSAVDAAYAPRRFALLVGITAVDDERWRPLRFAGKDAADLAQALTSPQQGAFTRVHTLTSKEDTTRAGILAALDALAREASRPDDVVVVYVSAHGTLGRDERGALARYVVTSDAQFHQVSTSALGVEALVQHLSAAGSRRRVLVLATCHSGSGKSLLPREVELELASLKGPAPRPLESASRAAMVLSASDFGETAREDEGLQNDIYTHFLVQALGGLGDRNGDGAVSATEAHDFARRHTWDFSGGRQRPSAEILEVGADPILLSGRIERLGRPEVFSYAARLDGFTLKVDGEARTELPGGAAMAPGTHAVELTKGGAVLLAEQVTVRTGDRLDLERLLERRAPWRTVSLLGGGFGFVDARSQQEVSPASPAVGVGLKLHRVLFERLTVALDVSGFRSARQLSLGGPGVPFTATSLQAGAAVLLPVSWGRVSLWAGPRVAGLWVERSFSLETYRAAQSALSVTPGLMAGAGITLPGNWELAVDTQLMVTVLTVDGAPRALGFVGGFASVGYRF